MTLREVATKVMIIAGVGLVGTGLALSEIYHHRPIDGHWIPLFTFGGILLLTGLALRPRDEFKIGDVK